MELVLLVPLVLMVKLVLLVLLVEVVSLVQLVPLTHISIILILVAADYSRLSGPSPTELTSGRRGWGMMTSSVCCVRRSIAMTTEPGEPAHSVPEAAAHSTPKQVTRKQLFFKIFY